MFEGESIVAKYELLKAATLGKVQGFKAYKKAINYVALNYANTDEGKSAQKLMQKSIPVLEKLKITKAETGTKFKLLYVLGKEDEEAKNIKEGIEKALKDTYKDFLSVSVDYYNSTTQLVVVHGFITPETARNFHFFLEENKKRYAVGKDYKVMSSDDYRTIQIHKNLNELQ